MTDTDRAALRTQVATLRAAARVAERAHQYGLARAHRRALVALLRDWRPAAPAAS